MAEQVKLTRKQLSQLTDNANIIRQLELLIRLVNSLEIPGDATLDEIIAAAIAASP